MNSSRFRADAGTKGGFSVINFPDNGERVRSLLCDREALAKPSGMAEQHEESRFNVGDQHAEISTRRNFSGCRAEPDQEALACRRYSKDTSCPRQLRSPRFW